MIFTPLQYTCSRESPCCRINPRGRPLLSVVFIPTRPALYGFRLRSIPQAGLGCFHLWIRSRLCVWDRIFRPSFRGLLFRLLCFPRWVRCAPVLWSSALEHPSGRAWLFPLVDSVSSLCLGPHIPAVFLASTSALPCRLSAALLALHLPLAFLQFRLSTRLRSFPSRERCFVVGRSAFLLLPPGIGLCLPTRRPRVLFIPARPSSPPLPSHGRRSGQRRSP